MIKCTTIHSIESIIDLNYVQYQGFKGSINDSILSNFTVQINNQFEKNGVDFLNSEQIRKIKDSNVTGILFDKIPDSILIFDKVVDYICYKYPNLHKKKIINNLSNGTDKEIIFLNDMETEIIRVQHFQFGISGTFVLFLCSNCI